MSIELSPQSTVCYRCGKNYSKWHGIFPVSYAQMYKGVGRLPICKSCIETMYNTYLAQCNEPRDAVHQMCRALNLYWSDRIFDLVIKKSTPQTVMSRYIVRLNSSAYLDRTYDDTLSEEGTLWSFRANANDNDDDGRPDAMQISAEADDIIFDDNDDSYVASDDVISFWGAGYTNSMYKELEQRFQYWKDRLPDDFMSDIGSEALIRQICALELDVNRDRAAGKSIDKSVTALNNLLGSLNLKPVQRRDDNEQAYDNTPFGVWIRRFENERPIPEPDPELQDSDGIIRYVLVWFYGHLAKMLGIKNAHSKLYEDEIAKLRVERPEYDEDDDETMLDDIFGNGDSDG